LDYYAFAKWAWEAYGMPGLALAVLLYFAVKNKESRPDIVGELMMDVKETKNTVIDLRERVSRIEGKLSND